MKDRLLYDHVAAKPLNLIRDFYVVVSQWTKITSSRKSLLDMQHVDIWWPKLVGLEPRVFKRNGRNVDIRSDFFIPRMRKQTLEGITKVYRLEWTYVELFNCDLNISISKPLERPRNLHLQAMPCRQNQT